MSEFKVGDFVVCTRNLHQATANTVYQVKRVNAETVTILGVGGWEVNLLFNEVTKYQEDKKMSEFKVGDKVKIVRGGWGIHDKHEGKIVTIAEVGASAAYAGGSTGGSYKIKEYLDDEHSPDEWVGGYSFKIAATITLEDTPMTDTEKAIYHLQSLLAVNKATIVITMDEIEILRHNEDETFNPCIEELDELLQALDVIERYED